MQTVRHNIVTHLNQSMSRALRALARAGMALAALVLLAMPAPAQTPSGPEVKKIANDLYFFFEFDGSNAVFLVTDEGVLPSNYQWAVYRRPT